MALLFCCCYILQEHGEAAGQSLHQQLQQLQLQHWQAEKAQPAAAAAAPPHLNHRTYANLFLLPQLYPAVMQQWRRSDVLLFTLQGWHHQQAGLPERHGDDSGACTVDCVSNKHWVLSGDNVIEEYSRSFWKRVCLSIG
jgi:hypothetical protein